MKSSLNNDILTFKNGSVVNGTISSSTAGIISMSSDSGDIILRGIKDPVNNQDAATKAYVLANAGGITPAALTASNDTNVTLTLGGSNTTALVNATSITAGWSGLLSSARGGTGVNNSGTITVTDSITIGSTTTINQLFYTSTSGTLSGITSAADSILTSNGSNVPSWSSTIGTSKISIPNKQILLGNTSGIGSSSSNLTFSDIESSSIITKAFLTSTCVISKNGLYIAVGDSDNTVVGKVTIYYFNGVSWGFQQELIGTGNSGVSQQGASVAFDENANYLAVGGPGDGTNIGATWIFIRSGTTWSQQAKLIGTGNLSQSNQGVYLSLNNDATYLAVGGPGDNSSIGATWIFTRSGTTWSQQAKLIGTGTIATTAVLQGSSLSLNSDATYLAVGGLGDNSNAGAVWIFTRSGSVWSQQGSKIVGTASVPSRQGITVALNSDATYLAYGGTNDNSYDGATWIFTRSDSTWTQQTKLIGSNSVNTLQGRSLSINNTCSVLAVYGELSVGIVWIFTREGTQWSEIYRGTYTYSGPFLTKYNLSMNVSGSKITVVEPTSIKMITLPNLRITSDLTVSNAISATTVSANAISAATYSSVNGAFRLNMYNHSTAQFLAQTTNTPVLFGTEVITEIIGLTKTTSGGGSLFMNNNIYPLKLSINFSVRATNASSNGPSLNLYVSIKKTNSSIEYGQVSGYTLQDYPCAVSGSTNIILYAGELFNLWAYRATSLTSTINISTDNTNNISTLNIYSLP